ncbi:MAG TPA: rhodanese-like domain-containing protein, partial [Nitrospirota bacterium]|nr:rhodanese-like domain-containing protein [Nitrospirota bacterium]
MEPGIRSKTLITIIVFVCALAANSYSASDGFKTIDTTQLHVMIVDNAYSLEGGRGLKFIIVDVRTKEEFDKSHIASAINIPERELEKFSALLPKDKGTLIVLYGNDKALVTSRKWADKAKAAGYTDIVIYSETLE